MDAAEANATSSVVLVVEDDPDVRFATSMTLESEGYGVVEAANGREALDLLEAADALPCTILLDLMMPVMDGWAFLQELRTRERLAGVPVVVVTASRLGRELDVSGYLEKPFTVEALLDVLGPLCPTPGDGAA